MTVQEFKDAKLYPGTEKEGERYMVLVKHHKTAGAYGAAVVWIYTDLYRLKEMYTKRVRSKFVKEELMTDKLFISSNGVELTSSQVSTSI